MMKPIRSIVLVFAALLIPSLSHSEVWVKDYENMKKPIPYSMETYIAGIGEGTGWANVINAYKGGSPLYCPPGKLALTSTNYVRILDDEIKLKQYPDGSGIEFVLIQGLQRVFPCR